MYGQSRPLLGSRLHGCSSPRKRRRVCRYPTFLNDKLSMTSVFNKVLCAMWILLYGDCKSICVIAATASVGTMDRTASVTTASSKLKIPWQKHRIRIPDTDGLANRTSNTTSVTSTSLIQIIESEYFDEKRGRWCANSNISETEDENILSEDVDTLFNDDSSSTPPQWTDAITGAIVPAPSEYELDANQDWVGEWNIAVTSKSSPHGWEYSRVHRRRRRHVSPLLRYTHRRRMWLRQVATTTKLQKSKRKSRKRPRFYSLVLKSIRDDWSFKGFGITLTKSAVFRKAFGVSFRLPLTLNFDTWERHPVLPHLSSSIAIFLPQLCLCLFLNLSIRIEYLQRALYYMAHVIPTLCTALLLLLLRGLALAVSALLYPLTRKPLLLATSNYGNGKYWNRNNLVLSTLLASQQNAQRRRRLQSDERIDLTCAWRWSVERGYEFRVFFSHWYCVDLAALLQTTVPCLPAQLSTTASVIKIMDWLPQHTAAVGWSFTGPVHQDNKELMFTGSALLSLSGFYLTKESSAQPTSSLSSGTSGVNKPTHSRVLLKQQLITNEEGSSDDAFTAKRSSPTKSKVVSS
jgi:hypothetical protein